MEKKSYAGNITNKGTQTVEAVYPQKKGKAPVKKTGEDLRTKGGNK